MKTLIDLIDGRIVIDILKTWPNPIISFINKKEKIIKNYLQLEQDLDIKQSTNVDLRYFRPKNKYEQEYLEIVTYIDTELSKLRFVGFHCTNLTSEEITCIPIEGLEPISPDLVKKKLNKLKEKGIIDSIQYNSLLSNNLSNKYSRSKMAWFFLFSRTLKNDVHGLINLLSLWGGEAIYKNNVSNKEMKKTLNSIGKPSIVLLDLEFNDIGLFGQDTLAQKMIEIYMKRNGNNDISYDSDCNKTQNVPVIDIITSDDDIFEELTGFSSWS